MKLLLKVEKNHMAGSVFYEGSLKVERICNDLSIIDAFDSVSNVDVFCFLDLNVLFIHYLFILTVLFV
jgi:hypothetical protein